MSRACQLPEHTKYPNGKCRTCNLERAKIWHKNNHDKSIASKKAYNKKNKQKRAEKHREDTYGLTPSIYEAMFNSQNGRCDICSEQTKLAVDHDHETGKVRGLLCFGCNAGLGQLHDSIQLLKNAITYLEKHND